MNNPYLSKLVFPGKDTLEMWQNLCNSYDTYDIAGQKFLVVSVDYCNSLRNGETVEVELTPIK